MIEFEPTIPEDYAEPTSSSLDTEQAMIEFKPTIPEDHVEPTSSSLDTEQAMIEFKPTIPEDDMEPTSSPLNTEQAMIEFRPTIPEDDVEPISSSLDTEQGHTSRFRHLWSSFLSIHPCFSNKTWTASNIRNWNLRLHKTSLLFAIPCLALIIVDLQTYMQNHEHARNQSNANGVVVLDAVALAFFAFTIIYAVAYHLAAHLSGDVDHSSSNNTSFVHKIPRTLFLIDIFHTCTVTTVADTILGMRTENTNTSCERWADVDSGICEGWRVNVMCAAGALGVVLR
jgi:hypothetical protein